MKIENVIRVLPLSLLVVVLTAGSVGVVVTIGRRAECRRVDVPRDVATPADTVRFEAAGNNLTGKHKIANFSRCR